MSRTLHAPVLVVGAGPVGLTLALDLAWRGIDVTVVETRPCGEPPPAKCNHVAARTMEVYRRLGIAGEIRNTGLPGDYPNDISFRTTFTGMELARIPIPCRNHRYTASGGPDTGWPTPEPPHRINQIYLEPILSERAAATARISLYWHTEFKDLLQNETGVTATLENIGSGETIHASCDYLVGCDGGSSAVRRSIGGHLTGDAVLQRCQSSFVRAVDLIQMQSEAAAWSTISLNPRRSGNVYAIDGRELWIIHNYLREEETDFDSVDRDHSIRMILGVDDQFHYDTLAHEDWIGRRLVADRFRDRRVFICGDAAHIWVPYAGYGMNAGIADATNLSWLLAAHLNGWAADAVLDAYECERLPITDQVSRFVMNHTHAMVRQRRAVPDNIELPGPEGDAVRKEMGRHAYDLNVQQYCAAGLNFGYFYEDSPIISHEAQTPPAYSMATFTPSTLPGCRLPHFFFKDGRSLYDALGPEFTLLRLNSMIDVSPILAAADLHDVPLQVLDIVPGSHTVDYDHGLVLCRPDQHVAWRGDRPPDDPVSLIDRVRGAASG